MIISLKKSIRPEEQEHLIQWLESKNVRVHISEGEFQTILGLVGDTTGIDMDLIRGLTFVEGVTRISEPFKKANRKFHPDDTVVRTGNGAAFGGGFFQLIAGPCSVESEAQVETIARAVKASGAGVLRGGAFKPRTSPYDFQGLHEEGIRILSQVKQLTGLPIITEIMDISHLPLFEDVDIIQVGARNMQNFELLKELGKTDKPILLKRGLANNIKELLMSAEYIMAGGNEQVILCERGVRTFETYTRNTLDLSAVAVLHELSHLPGSGGPQPRHRCSTLCKAHGPGGGRLRGGRPDDRGAQRSAPRAVRRTPVPDAGTVRRRGTGREESAGGHPERIRCPKKEPKTEEENETRRREKRQRDLYTGAALICAYG